METTFTFPTENLQALQKRVADANKKALKFGVAPLILEIGETFTVTDRINGFDQDRQETEATLTGETPKLDGWSFLASLELGENGAIIRSLPGTDCPEDQRERGNVCDHCGNNRHRKHTYVVQNESGEVFMVGRQCLKDFMGHGRFNPAFIAQWFQTIGEIIDGDGEYYGAKSGPRRYSLADVLRLTGAIVSMKGWVSGGMARSADYDSSTASEVSSVLDPPIKPSYKDRQFIGSVRTEASSPVRVEEAGLAIEWILGKEVQNDYIHTCQVIAKDGWVDRKRMGFACSILTAWRIELGRELERAERATREAMEGKDSDYIGEIGKRMKIKVKVTRVLELPNDFRVTILHLMEDEQGNRIKWFASGRSLGEGFEGTVKATVKTHNEYKGVKETVVNRVVEV